MGNAIQVKVTGAQKAPYTYITKILKPNLTEDDDNILDLSLILDTKTKYVIKWDYDLKGTTITIPEKCLIEFDGGSISNGKLIGNNTYLILYLDKEEIIKNVSLEGTFKYSIQLIIE